MDKKQKIIAIVVVVLGLTMLVVGVIFLVLKLTAQPKVADGDFLVSTGNWVLEDDACAGQDTDESTGETQSTDAAQSVDGEAGAAQDADGAAGAMQSCGPRVIWNFTEIGKGTLTANNHLNDYSFEWAIVDDELIMRTDWLYELDNEYKYELDQEKGVLTLTTGQQKYVFTPEK